jgi:hypothetical protein
MSDPGKAKALLFARATIESNEKVIIIFKKLLKI